MKWIRLICVSALFVNTLAHANQDLFLSMGNRYGVDPLLLRAIGTVESTLHPWTLNVNGHSFFFDTKEDVITFLYNLRTHPWLITIKNLKGRTAKRLLFESKSQADDYLRKAGISRFSLDRLKPSLADIGIMQINWHFTGSDYTQQVSRLIDPDFNIAAAAHHLRNLIDRYGLQEGIGRYHSGNPRKYQPYAAKVFSVYSDLKKLYQNQLSVAPSH